eukprot:TRINITY_DN7879_c0_g1_i1.p1 TRINITY_DN7879_c0_g1~~TRINITY_DN7879_c0_g1_i1.p1  ORF type:complete len:174 (-),score=38.81 TRINITY_DN7879_c0_g1_i1:65-586(-)
MQLWLSVIFVCFFLMIRRPPRSTLSSSSAASDVYKRQEEALKIQELNMLHLENSFIEIVQSSSKEFLQLITYHFTKQPPQISIQRNNIKEMQKRRKTILVEGAPLNCQKKDIYNYFGDFVLKESDIILLAQPNGAFSGNVLVTFEDQIEAMRAMKEKNFQNLGNSYVELYEYK